MTGIRRLASFAVALAFLAAPPARALESSKAFHRLSAVNKIEIHSGEVANTAPATARRMWPHKTGGQLFDFMCRQITAGTGGTSVSFDLQKNGTTMLATLGLIPIGAGADKVIDLQRDIAAVANTVRPVPKTATASIRVAKGDVISIVTTEAGTYSPHPTYECTATFVPDL